MKIRPPYQNYNYFRKPLEITSLPYLIDFSILAYSEPEFINYKLTKITSSGQWCEWRVIYNKNFQCFVIGDKHYNAVVVFRGTESWHDWEVDFDILLNNQGFHKGFYDAVDTLFNDIEPLIYNKYTIFTGHSLGAAMAAIAAYRSPYQYSTPKIINFGQPKIGDSDAANAVENIFWQRYVHGNDIITRAPMKCMDYVHRGYEIQLPQTPRPWWQFINTQEPYVWPIALWDHCPLLYAEQIWKKELINASLHFR